MAHHPFARQRLGSSALVILAALHANPHQTVGDPVATSAVSRATTYQTLHRVGGFGTPCRRGSGRGQVMTPSWQGSDKDPFVVYTAFTV